jgi:membrane protein involved in colicin uptake
MGIPPTAFSFRNSDAMVGVDTGSAQQVIDFFKVWLPKATQELKRSLTENARRAEAQRLEKLRQEQRAEEERLKANRGLRF